ncbi:hypothetical protein B1B04_13845 [Lysinibacillus sp. KCTC 33748]|uniref:hypothetical protein n=1 Tax=unclassified Lysinibacillus TaxID=2636778 RepID=UPI0009A680A0|nr:MULTISPECIES: hypothetical protein [unclassified Lysinibacillus]OXS73041.1 hypothetical protein B1B04_13845 [Lysinibacillus sp. KCTC 33748]SKB86494.1 hypothetical protein SAMN06295926_11088 [Lysinibacillus sp. AC-3]
MNELALNILPPQIKTVDTHFAMEVLRYEYGWEVDEYGDREIVDTSNSYKVKAKVPRISFLEWIDTLCNLKYNGVLATHLYTRELLPYVSLDSSVWKYFDQVEGNLLTNGSTYRNADKVRIYVYFIEEFNHFVILRLLSHHDIVFYKKI